MRLDKASFLRGYFFLPLLYRTKEKRLAYQYKLW